jgi:hypothetical protein
LGLIPAPQTLRSGHETHEGFEMARKIIVSVSTGFVGCRKEEEIEVDDDATDEQIDEEARDVMLSMIEWNWRDASEKC